MDEVKSVLSIICSSYNDFFDSEKKIANCILERKNEVIDMTVAELAQASGASDASVSRFCRRCGFKGFHQLKMSLAREVVKEHTTKVSNDISRDCISQSLQNILANKTEELKQTVSMINPENLDRILTLLENASIVQVAAVGNTIPVALDAAFKLNQLGIPAVSGTILESQTAFTFNLKKGDVVLVISNSGSSKRLCTLIKGAKENKASVIAVTNNPNSPVAVLSDYHITTATREKLLLGEFCFSRVSATTVVEILYLFLAVGLKDAYKHVRRHEAAIADDRIINK